jgi:hypothetical protein
MNWEGFGGKWSWPSRSTIPAQEDHKNLSQGIIIIIIIIVIIAAWPLGSAVS